LRLQNINRLQNGLMNKPEEIQSYPKNAVCEGYLRT